MGTYMPHFTLTSTLTGIIPATILSLKGRDEIKAIELGMAIAIGQIITSILLTPYFLYTLFGLPLKVIMPGFILGEVINIPLYTLMIGLFLKRYYSVFPSK